MRIDEYVFEKIKKVEEKTMTDYDIIWKDAENAEGYVTADDLFTMVEDLLYEIDHLEEKIEDLENKDKEPDFYDYWQDQQLEEGKL